ncbi:putative Ferroporti-1 [Seiridium unicorne]|uniref:Solute carrier family 40 member n=1 Tax=Seiridium unicorne TaxID=138068 RepID=A0ABR2VBE7_9PEZI
MASDHQPAEAESGGRASQHGGYIAGLMEMQPMRPVDDNDEEPEAVPVDLPRSLAVRLYISHFLSTWNSRLFEFGAVLFLASIYPNTLLPMSVYALVRSASAILFAQSIGSWIDRGNRLTVVRVSIIGQRLAVAASCAILWIMEQKVGLTNTRVTDTQFALVVLLAVGDFQSSFMPRIACFGSSPVPRSAFLLLNHGFRLPITRQCVEKLCSVMNLVSVERDWVVVITEGNESLRRTLNARMRRIDLLCKLLGPLVISNVAIASTLIAIWATLAMNIISVMVEYICIAQVYDRIPALKRMPTAVVTEAVDDEEGRNTHAVQAWLKSMKTNLLPIDSLPFYFHQPAFLPSFSLSLLYLTVLSFSGIARTVSTIFELSATWIAPRMMKRIGPVRGGIWSLSWQMIWLAGSISWFFSDFHGAGTNSVLAGTGLAVGVALSRVGLWGYDLCAQTIVQDEVEADHRGTFSTVEAAFQNLFELFSYVTTIIFSRPDQFQWPVERPPASFTAMYMREDMRQVMRRFVIGVTAMLVQPLPLQVRPQTTEVTMRQHATTSDGRQIWHVSSITNSAIQDTA